MYRISRAVATKREEINKNIDDNSLSYHKKIVQNKRTDENFPVLLFLQNGTTLMRLSACNRWFYNYMYANSRKLL